jgi:hypothetical protein
MVKAIGRRYTAHKDYDVILEKEILNMKIRITGADYEQTGAVDYEGTICKFIKERIPAESIVELLAGLKYTDKLLYKFHGGENIIQRI